MNGIQLVVRAPERDALLLVPGPAQRIALRSHPSTHRLHRGSPCNRLWNLERQSRKAGQIGRAAPWLATVQRPPYVLDSDSGLTCTLLRRCVCQCPGPRGCGIEECARTGLFRSVSPWMRERGADGLTWWACKVPRSVAAPCSSDAKSSPRLGIVGISVPGRKRPRVITLFLSRGFSARFAKGGHGGR